VTYFFKNGSRLKPKDSREVGCGESQSLKS
jgi:hypothetical protein